MYVDAIVVDIYKHGVLGKCVTKISISEFKNNTFPPILNIEPLVQQFKIFKVFVLKKRLRWEKEKTSAIDVAEAQNKRYKNKLETLDTLLSQRTQIETQKKIKNTEKEIEALEKHRTYMFQTLLTDWIVG